MRSYTQSRPTADPAPKCLPRRNSSEGLFGRLTSTKLQSESHTNDEKLLLLRSAFWGMNSEVHSSRELSTTQLRVRPHHSTRTARYELARSIAPSAIFERDCDRVGPSTSDSAFGVLLIFQRLPVEEPVYHRLYEVMAH